MLVFIVDIFVFFWYDDVYVFDVCVLYYIIVKRIDIILIWLVFFNDVVYDFIKLKLK